MRKSFFLIPALLMSLANPTWAEVPEEATDRDELRAEIEQARADLAAAAQRLARLTRELSESSVAQRWPEGDRLQWLQNLGELPDSAAIRRAIAVSWSPRLGVVLGAEDEQTTNRIRAVTPGSNAAAAGLEAGDRLLTLDGTDIRHQTAARTRQLLREREPGETVRVEVERDGETLSFEVSLERPELPGMALLRGDGQRFNFEGLSELLEGPMRSGRAAGLGRRTQLTAMHAGLEPYFGTDRGVLVLRIDPDMALSLEAGDVILSVDGQAVSLPAELMRSLVALEPGQELVLDVLRRGQTLSISSDWNPTQPSEERRQGG